MVPETSYHIIVQNVSIGITIQLFPSCQRQVTHLVLDCKKQVLTDANKGRPS